MHCGDIIKCDLFYLNLLLFQTKEIITFWWKSWKEKHKNIALISRFKYDLKICHLERFTSYLHLLPTFLTYIKNNINKRNKKKIKKYKISKLLTRKNEANKISMLITLNNK